MLDGDHEFGKGVVLHGEFVVGGCEVLEEAVADGEEGHVLDVGVVFGRIGYEVMHVVISLPPARAQAAEIIGDEHGENRIGVEVVRDADVRGIVDREGKLVPKEAKRKGSGNVPPSPEA